MVKLTDARIAYAVRQVQKGVFDVRWHADHWGVTPRRLRQVIQEWRRSGQVPTLKKHRRPRAPLLTAEEAAAIDRAWEENGRGAATSTTSSAAAASPSPIGRSAPASSRPGRSSRTPGSSGSARGCGTSGSTPGASSTRTGTGPRKAHPHVIVWIDDASRRALSGGEFPSETAEASIATFEEARARAREWALEVREANTDQGVQFYAPHGTSRFAAHLEAHGIRHAVSRRNHPQTNGKSERASGGGTTATAGGSAPWRPSWPGTTNASMGRCGSRSRRPRTRRSSGSSRPRSSWVCSRGWRRGWPRVGNDIRALHLRRGWSEVKYQSADSVQVPTERTRVRGRSLVVPFALIALIIAVPTPSLGGVEPPVPIIGYPDGSNVTEALPGTIMVWLDVLAGPADGSWYLRQSDLTQVINRSGKIAGIGFSPDQTQLWYWIETTPENRSQLLSVPNAVSLLNSQPTGYPYWNQSWRHFTRIEPYVQNYSSRLASAGVNVVSVMVNYRVNGGQGNGTTESAARNSTISTLMGLGGTIDREGLDSFVIATIPIQNLESVLNNQNVTTIIRNGPIILSSTDDFMDSQGADRIEAEASPADSTINRASPLPGLETIVAVASFMAIVLAVERLQKGRRPRKLAGVGLACVFLLLTTAGSAAGLNISRQTVGAGSAPNQGAGVTVCVIDTGIDTNNGYLSGAVVGGWPSGGGNVYWDDRYGHGTHVAGIIAARTSPAYGGTQHQGVASEVKLYSMKSGFTFADTRDAIKRCVTQRNSVSPPIRVISLAQEYFDVFSGSYGDATHEAIRVLDDAVRDGLTVVVTSGNFVYNIYAEAFNVIVVGALDHHGTTARSDDTHACYSTFGYTQDGRRRPDVVAPGSHSSTCGPYQGDDETTGLWSTRTTDLSASCTPGTEPRDLCDAYPNGFDSVCTKNSAGQPTSGCYGRLGGTSQALSHVSAEAAIILTKFPSWSPMLVKAAIREKAVRDPTLVPTYNADRWGFGLIDIPASAASTPSYVFGWDSFYRRTGSSGSTHFSYSVPNILGNTPFILRDVWLNNYLNCPFGWCALFSKKVFHMMRTDNVWAGGIPYSLDGSNMVNPPRIDEAYLGHERVTAGFSLPNGWVVASYAFDMTYPPQIKPSVNIGITTGSPVSLEVQSYYDGDVRGPGNDVISRYSDGYRYNTEIKVQNTEVRTWDDCCPHPRVRTTPNPSDSAWIWLLRCCPPVTSNPDLSLNGESINRQDIVMFYKAYRGPIGPGSTYGIGPTIYVEHGDWW